MRKAANHAVESRFSCYDPIYRAIYRSLFSSIYTIGSGAKQRLADRCHELGARAWLQPLIATCK